MKLIVESGATKGDWRLITDSGEEIGRFLAGGTNVSTMPMTTIAATIRETGKTVLERADEKIASVHFYTAGVITPAIESEMSSLLKSIFCDADIEVKDDLLAAARAVCGHEEGIAAILGTGSNSCHYVGEKIIDRVYSSGFILGDEGSAATLGKLFIADFLKGFVPEHIAKDFSSRYDTSYASIVENVYRTTGSPSGYLGSFAPFIMEYYADPYIKSLVDNNFRAFFIRSIKQYQSCPVGVVGGFGYALKDIIQKVAAEEKIEISCFMKCPIEGLKKYHSTKS